jgi:hypothetical protein
VDVGGTVQREHTARLKLCCKTLCTYSESKNHAVPVSTLQDWGCFTSKLVALSLCPLPTPHTNLIIQSKGNLCHPISNCKSHRLSYQIFKLELRCKNLYEVTGKILFLLKK